MSDFARKLIAWHARHGRRDLPWQGTRDAYRIWVSEIMLQQTQVATVIPYYQRFIARFADVAALARADEDEVLAFWAGLGYYSRGRNLHRAARVIMSGHVGRFPTSVEAIEALPGIGRSTAAAIAAFAFATRAAILDGNVKRVLARHFGIEGVPTERAVEMRLWSLAHSLLPTRNAQMPAYTQAIMDLGATVCTRAKPACAHCPVRETCFARVHDRIAQLPTPKPSKALPARSCVMLLVEHGDAWLFEKRPAQGVWGGLWCFPQIETNAGVAQALERYVGQAAQKASRERLTPFVHTFTHFKLTIQPLRIRLAGAKRPRPAAGTVWMDAHEARGAAIPKPVRTLIDALSEPLLV